MTVFLIFIGVLWLGVITAKVLRLEKSAKNAPAAGFDGNLDSDEEFRKAMEREWQRGLEGIMSYNLDAAYGKGMSE